jgi:hypothetical protein
MDSPNLFLAAQEFLQKPNARIILSASEYIEDGFDVTLFHADGDEAEANVVAHDTIQGALQDALFPTDDEEEDTDV